MQYKAVFCDIDGTLLTTDKRLTHRTAGAVKALSEKGIPFILVSARMPKGIEETRKALSLTTPIISGGGALITGMTDSASILYETGLSYEEASRIMAALPENTSDFCYGVYSGEHWITKDRTHPQIAKEEIITNVIAEEGDPLSILTPKDSIHKFLCMGDGKLLDDLKDRLAPLFPEAAFHKSAPHLLEIIKNTCSKSAAIHFLCAELGISPQECISFGDNYNDIDMLQCVGHSVAMGNAPEPVKRSASETTDTNDNDGVAQYIEQNLL